MKTVAESLVVWPCDLKVTTLLTEMLILRILAVQFVLSISMIICTNSPGMYPSFSKDIFDDVNPLLMQQQLLISPWDSLCCAVTNLVYLSIIWRPPWILNCLVTGSIAAVIW